MTRAGRLARVYVRASGHWNAHNRESQETYSDESDPHARKVPRARNHRAWSSRDAIRALSRSAGAVDRVSGPGSGHLCDGPLSHRDLAKTDGYLIAASRRASSGSAIRGCVKCSRPAWLGAERAASAPLLLAVDGPHGGSPACSDGRGRFRLLHVGTKPRQNIGYRIEILSGHPATPRHNRPFRDPRATRSRRGSWGADDSFVFGSANTELMRIPAGGGNWEELTTPAAGESHSWPWYPAGLVHL